MQSKSNSDQKDFKNCVNFTRRQKNKDDISHNYMIYKEQKNVFVDTTNINIYLKCDDIILAIIPYADYFTLECDTNQQNCIMVSKESLYNFIFFVFIIDIISEIKVSRLSISKKPISPIYSSSRSNIL